MKTSVLITGASSGIGQMTAQLFSQKGYFVHLAGRNIEHLKKTQSICSGATEIHPTDLTNPDDIKKLFQNVTQTQNSPPCLVLVNNAGIFNRHTQTEGTDEIWQKQFEVNLLAPVRLTREFIPYWKAHEKASVVNVSSTLGLRPSINVSSYSAIKAALINWTQSLALEEGSWGLRANAVCPGLVDTPIHDFHSLPITEKEKVLEGLSKLQPLMRIGTPEEIARSIYFLGSDDSSWTTGAILSVDGGINLT